MEEEDVHLVQLWLRALNLVGYQFPVNGRFHETLMSGEHMRLLSIGKTMKDLSQDYTERLYKNLSYLNSTCVLNTTGKFIFKEKE